MMIKTEAIVLRSIPYGESSIITTIFTRQQGLKTFLVRAGKGAKGQAKSNLFKPLNLVVIDYFQKENKSIQYLSDARLFYYYKSLNQDPVKITSAFLMLEILRNCLKEEEKNLDLYDFILKTLMEMDTESRTVFAQLSWFLLHLTRFVGFMPYADVRENCSSFYFDIESGRIEESTRGNDKIAELVYQFCTKSAEEAKDIIIHKEERKALILRIIKYYLHHIEGFQEPESLQIMEDVFRN